MIINPCLFAMTVRWCITRIKAIQPPDVWNWLLPTD